jgi:hypothetical protein
MGARRYQAHRSRRILCVFPRYRPSFGTFEHAYGLMPGVRAFMPPQGILLVAACLPARWSVRVVDENHRPVAEADLRWSDAVLISGMHVQRAEINRLMIRYAARRGAGLRTRQHVPVDPDRDRRARRSAERRPAHPTHAGELLVGQLGDVGEVDLTPWHSEFAPRGLRAGH